MVKLYDVVKWQNVQKLCCQYIAITLTTTKEEKCSSVYVIYLNLFKDHFWWRDLGIPQPAVEPTMGHVRSPYVSQGQIQTGSKGSHKPVKQFRFKKKL